MCHSLPRRQTGLGQWQFSTPTELAPAFLHSPYLTLYKTDISLRRTLSVGPKVSVLEMVGCYFITNHTRAANVKKIGSTNTTVGHIPSTHTFEGRHIQLFRERLSDKVNATNPKGIVGGLEFTVFQRNLKEWQEMPWKYVCE